MLTEADIAPIIAALDDGSPQVEEAALRVIGLMMPLISGDRVQDRVRLKAESPAESLRALAEEVLEGTLRPPLSIPEQRSTLPASEWKPSEWDSPERWRKTLLESTDVRHRLIAACQLAAIGTTDWLEPVLDELERSAFNLAPLRDIREERFPALPSPLGDRLRAIANDPTRRGDVRQIAHLLAVGPGGAGGSEKPPYTSDLVRNAAALADRYLDASEIGIHFDEVEAFRYLEPERASLLITVSFHLCVAAAHSCDMGYAVGNDIGRLLGAFGDAFVPDIAALFEIYLEMFSSAAEARAKWYSTRDENVLFSTPGHLAVSWQIAWTVGRTGLVETIAALGPSIDSTEREERLAALQLLEDVIRFLPVPYFPQYGGATTPEMDEAVVLRGVSGSLTTAGATAGYRTVRVFYGTNRQQTGSELPARRYGTLAGDLQLGTCDVSIPHAHKIGMLESPPLYDLNWRSNPSRYVVLLKIECRPKSDFCAAVKQRVQTSKDKQALVFVHGYRVSFEDAARRTAQLADDLQIATPIFFSWPSRAKLFGYPADAVMAERSVTRLVEFLDLVSTESGAEVIHLIAHSMGSLALSKAVIEYLETHRGSEGPKLRELILAAPDIDAEIFREQIVPKIAGRGPRITLYASRRDYALLASRWLRSGLTRAGFVEGGLPLVTAEVETVDVSAVNTECFWGLLQGHSYVGDRATIIQDMSALLHDGTNASRRFGNREAYINGLPYWIMKPRSA